MPVVRGKISLLVPVSREGFYQAFTANDLPVNSVFALDLDSAQPDGAFTYSTAQIYQTRPVARDTSVLGGIPAVHNEQNQHIAGAPEFASQYGAYDHGRYLLSHAELHRHQSHDEYVRCDGRRVVSRSVVLQPHMEHVYIPSLVSGTTAYVGFTAGTGSSQAVYPLYINSFVYSVLSAAATPTFSPVAGDYGSTQSVTISASTGPTICYNTTGAPATNGTTGCTNGTLYSGAISVPSGRTIYAVAGGTGYGDSPVASSAYQIASTASQPTFSASSGTYQGDQYVILNAAQGGVICYNTTGSPATNGSTGCTTGTLYSGPITVVVERDSLCDSWWDRLH